MYLGRGVVSVQNTERRIRCVGMRQETWAAPALAPELLAAACCRVVPFKAGTWSKYGVNITGIKINLN